MKSAKFIVIIFFICAAIGAYAFFWPAIENTQIPHALILNAEDYHDHHLKTISEQLTHRIHVQPLNLAALIIFVLAVTHTFFANTITAYAERLKKNHIKEHAALAEPGMAFHNRYSFETFGIEMLRFLGEVEVIFGLWVIPLLAFITFMYDWHIAVDYLSDRNYVEPLFVIVMMALASTAPVVKFAENNLSRIAHRGGDTVKSWWFTLLIIGTLLGSFITEPAAMTLTALLLEKQFFKYKPSQKFAYATLGLLFTNISVGGVLTNFSAPPVLMVSRVWNWDTSFMFYNFGIKAVVGIVLASLIYGYFFKEDFKKMQKLKQELKKQGQKDESDIPIPFWIMGVNLFFLIWIVMHSHYPVIFMGSFVMFLGFFKATHIYQKKLELKSPILVGFFLAGLVVHGSLQGWWIEPLLTNIHHDLLMIIAMVLTAFNDNASITYLASLNPNLNELMKYSLMVGALAGGGVTVIANAPNPAGQAILSKHFHNGISPLKLLLGALFPTLVMVLAFYLWK